MADFEDWCRGRGTLSQDKTTCVIELRGRRLISEALEDFKRYPTRLTASELIVYEPEKHTEVLKLAYRSDTGEVTHLHVTRSLYEGCKQCGEPLK